MKKILAVLLLAIVVIGCGPKMATQETLDALAEARAALESAQTRIAELGAEFDELTSMKMKLENEIADLNSQIDELQSNIDKRCKK